MKKSTLDKMISSFQSKSVPNVTHNNLSAQAGAKDLTKFKIVFLDILVIIAVLVSGFIRFWQVKDFNFAFTFDQARDMLEIRPMANFLDLKLTGPTTSINGLLLGPFYYYFNLPPFWLSGGSPQALTDWNILSFLATGLFFYFTLKRFDNIAAFFVTLFYLLSPQLFVITSYFWNANAAVYIGGLFFLSLLLYSREDSVKNTIFMAVMAALTMQFEAAFGVVCVGYAFLIVFLNRKLPQIKTLLIVSIPFFIPQLLFELAHKFPMTQYFIDSFSPTKSVLGVKTPITEIISTHYIAITDMFEGQMWLPYGYGLYLWLVSFIAMLISHKYRKTALYFFGFLLFSFLFYVAIYHHPLKVWYLQGYRIWYLIVWGFGLSLIIKWLLSPPGQNKWFRVIKPAKYFLLVLLFTFLVRNFYLVLLDKYNVIVNSQKSNDPKNARNIIATIDWVYNKADGTEFEAYTYVPEVYEYPYQYFYWWHGNKQYGYAPKVASYSLSDVPVYLNMADKFIQTQGGGKSEKIALIYEINGTYDSWLNQFKDYCVLDKQTFFWPVTAEWREKCKQN